MNHEEVLAKLKRLSKATKNTPTADDLDLMAECIVDNALTDEEINRGYAATRDAAEPWWPKPGEFLARARPKMDSAVLFRTEGDTIFQAILDHPQRYGQYNPHTGRIYDRRLIEKAHGAAAGIAWASVASRFRGQPDDEGKWLQFARKEFMEAYEAAREEHPAPTLTPPSRQLQASPGAKAEVSGAVEDQSKAQEDEKRLSTLIRNVPNPKPVSFDERMAKLRRQAEELRHGSL